MHGTAVPWEPQEMPGHTVQPFSEVLLCGHEIALVLLHRRQHAQIAQYPAVVVVGDVILNHGNKIFPAREAFHTPYSININLKNQLLQIVSQTVLFIVLQTASNVGLEKSFDRSNNHLIIKKYSGKFKNDCFLH